MWGHKRSKKMIMKVSGYKKDGDEKKWKTGDERDKKEW